MKLEIHLPKPLVPLFPIPVVLVTCGNMEKSNIITVGWIGVVCSEPPQIGIAIRPQRHSYNLIKSFKEFVINIPTTHLIEQLDICGKISGRNKDKFIEAKLTKIPSQKVSVPSIEECPINVECKCIKSIDLGSHNLFIGEILASYANIEIINPNSNWSIDFSKIDLICINLFEYWSIGNKLGEVYKIDIRGLTDAL